MKPLSIAISEVGSQQALARAIGVVQSAVSAWLKRGTVPPEHCLAIERASNGKVKRQDLRPTDYWRIWPDLEEPQSAQAVQEASHA